MRLYDRGLRMRPRKNQARPDERRNPTSDRNPPIRCAGTTGSVSSAVNLCRRSSRDASLAIDDVDSPDEIRANRPAGGGLIGPLLLTVLATITVIAALPLSASASDGQVRATIIRGINAVNREKVIPLTTDLIVIRTTLLLQAATTSKMRTAKALALSGFHYAQLAAAEQAEAAQDIKDANYTDPANFDPAKADAAQTQLGLAVTNQTASIKLLRRAASLIGYRTKIK